MMMQNIEVQSEDTSQIPIIMSTKELAEWTGLFIFSDRVYDIKKSPNILSKK
jgi:hypothetical protein